MNTDTIEILKLVSSFLTPLAVIFIGYNINKNIERTKAEILKEKEWQVLWAELFLSQAIEFNKNVSLIMSALFQLQEVIRIDSGDTVKSIEQIKNSLSIIQHIGWDIQNFAQFAKESGREIVIKQEQIIDRLNNLLKEKKGDSEEIRKLQFEYNQAVRKAHNEILKTA